MREPPTNICPLLAIASIGSSGGPFVCIKERCALWDFADNECALVSIPYAILEASESLTVQAHQCNEACLAAKPGEKRQEQGSYQPPTDSNHKE